MLARALSIIGHPAIVLPLVITVRMVIAGPRPQLNWFIIGVSIFVAGTIVLYSWLEVRRGNWTHVDASNKTERTKLNLILAAVLLGSTFGATLLDQSPIIPLGLFISSLMPVFALLLSKYLKVSLHTSFTAFAAFLFWPSILWVLVGFVLSLAIGWSRLVLGKHTFWEVLTGAVIGCAAGIVLLSRFHVLTV